MPIDSDMFCQSGSSQSGALQPKSLARPLSGSPTLGRPFKVDNSRASSSPVIVIASNTRSGSGSLGERAIAAFFGAAVFGAMLQCKEGEGNLRSKHSAIALRKAVGGNISGKHIDFIQQQKDLKQSPALYSVHADRLQSLHKTFDGRSTASRQSFAKHSPISNRSFKTMKNHSGHSGNPFGTGTRREAGPLRLASGT